ncbi:hypothetical protein [Gaetbulibacter aestuarii]|uniref:Uncharacterized protein n=1 Tax=Gaetbulibacter aestuarii TaxID=1502358 RepID=A0ABW7MU65_9FLAO
MKSILEILNLYKIITLNSDLSKEDLIVRFKKLIDTNDNYLFDELTKSDKKYIGIINEERFKIRVKRKFMQLSFPGYAKGKIIDMNGNTSLKIECFAYDSFMGLGLILVPVLFLILVTIVILNKAYPALLILVPIFIILLLFQVNFGRNMMMSFKKELIQNLNEL